MYNAAKPFSDQNYKSSIKKEMLKINSISKKLEKIQLKYFTKAEGTKF